MSYEMEVVNIRLVNEPSWYSKEPLDNPDKNARFPGFKADMVDTTGAGDSFWGGFLKCLLDSGKRPGEVSLEEAAEFAKYGNAVASLCVGKRGAIPAMPTVEEIEERLKL